MVVVLRENWKYVHNTFFSLGVYPPSLTHTHIRPRLMEKPNLFGTFDCLNHFDRSFLGVRPNLRVFEN